MYFPKQVHSDTILLLTEEHRASEEADAVLTDKKGRFIGIKTADCLPILLYNDESGVVGAVHAGWRGTGKAILKKTLLKMKDLLGVELHRTFLAIGPSIRQCCYPVGKDVVEEIERVSGDGFYIKKEDSFYVDLVKANIIQAVSSGVPRDNIWVYHGCTSCNTQRFFSWRAERTTERQLAIIGMRR